MSYSEKNIDCNDTVYMVMTDRFYDGNPLNNGKLGTEYRPGDLHFYQGGDWQGLTKKLPYIKALGFTTLWMSAPQDNELLSRTGDEAGYHGYYTRDFNSPNPHFGTSEDLRTLIAEADRLGLKVVIDAQLNHTADYLAYPSIQYDPPEYRPAAPFDNPSWYHNTPNIINFDDPYEAQNYSLGGLDDLAQEVPDCWKALMDAYWDPENDKGWFAYGFAGSRVDAVVEIPAEYLSKFEEHTGKHSFGEAFTGSVEENSFYQNYLWGMLDYPLYFQLNNVFCKGEDWSGIKWVIDQDWRYKAPHHLFTFIDNHDRARFLANASDNISKLHLALAFIYSARGIPVVYYGTEQQMAGDFRYTEQTINFGNRELMHSFDEHNRTFMYIQRLNEIRKDYSNILARGRHTELWYQEKDPVYAFRKDGINTYGTMICVFNNSPKEQKRTFYIGKARLTYTNLLNTKNIFYMNDGYLSVTVPGNTAMFLVPGKVTAYCPESPIYSRIVVHFDAGYGNTLFIRGDMKPFDWNYGLKCENYSNDTWIFDIERPKSGTLNFKVLLNDMVWQSGFNEIMEIGQVKHVWPYF